MLDNSWGKVINRKNRTIVAPFFCAHSSARAIEKNYEGNSKFQ